MTVKDNRTTPHRGGLEGSRCVVHCCVRCSLTQDIVVIRYFLSTCPSARVSVSLEFTISANHDPPSSNGHSLVLQHTPHTHALLTVHTLCGIEGETTQPSIVQ